MTTRYIENRRFDERYRRGEIPASGQSLAVGYMCNASDIPVDPGGEPAASGFDYDPANFSTERRYKLNFLYNPSMITFHYDLRESALAAIGADTLNESQLGVPLVVNGLTMGTSLIFIREYETALLDAPLRGADWLRNPQNEGEDRTFDSFPGVLHDMFILQRMVGLLPSTPQMEYDAVDLKPTPLVHFVFGSRSSAIWTGVVSGFSIKFNRFARNMVPVICTVNDLQITRQFRTEDQATGAAGADQYVQLGSPANTDPTTTGGMSVVDPLSGRTSLVSSATAQAAVPAPPAADKAIPVAGGQTRGFIHGQHVTAGLLLGNQDSSRTPPTNRFHFFGR